MAIQAPETPTTPELHGAYPVYWNHDMAIQVSRLAVTETIKRPGNMLVIGGPCAVTEDIQTFEAESRQWDDYVDSPFSNLSDRFAEQGANLVFMQGADGEPVRTISGIVAQSMFLFLKRTNIWKPRSNPDDPHGLETGGFAGLRPQEAAELAFLAVHGNSVRHANTALELSFPYQVDRYGRLATFAWLGSRLDRFYTDANGTLDIKARNDFIKYLAISQPTLPVGVKNELGGDIEEAMKIVDMINRIRTGEEEIGELDMVVRQVGRIEEGKTMPVALGKLAIATVAPAVLIYRGGENAKDPESWISNAEAAVIATNGRAILDMAHGAEMACDPNGEFKKTVEGQAIAWDYAIDLASRRRYVGNITETSNVDSPMDPPLPIDMTRDKMEKMAKARLPIAA